MIKTSYKPLKPGQVFKKLYLQEDEDQLKTIAKKTDIPYGIWLGIISGTQRISKELDKKICDYIVIPRGTYLKIQNYYDTFNEYMPDYEKKPVYDLSSVIDKPHIDSDSLAANPHDVFSKN